MTDRLLDAAADAYYWATRTGSDDAERLRRRLLGSLSARQKRRHFVAAWALPAAAVLFTGAAVAASGSRLSSAIVRAFTSRPSPAESPSSVRGAPSRAAVVARNDPARSEPRSAQAEAGTTASTADEKRTRETRASAAPVDRPQPSHRINTRIDHPDAPASNSDAGSSPRASASARELALFRAAQQVHFSEREPARALEGWEEYLAQFPHGALSKEARFNRGLCLVRLGRTDAAADVLGPLSRDGAEGYRSEDARALVRALKRE